MNRKLTQSGFTALDTTLVVVLLAALAAAGYYAYQNMHNSGTGSSTASVSPIPHATPTPALTVETGGVLTITQFEVKLTLPSALSGMGYTYSAASTMKDATGKSFPVPAGADLISAQLKGQKSSCKDPGYVDAEIAGISRDTVAPTNQDGSPMTLPNPLVKKIGTYYYELGLPNGDCFQGTPLDQTVMNQRTLIQQAFGTLAQQ